LPKKGGTLTPQERVLAKNYAVTGNRAYSGQMAGFSDTSGAASKALARPQVQAEIRKQQLELLFSQVLPLAVKVHMEIIGDPKAPAGARVQAVKLAYDRTLGQQEGQEGKEPHEMTSEEIAKAIAQLEQIAFERAKPVENAQSAQAVRNEDVFS
jgi:phage terminase small subunit